MTPTPFWFGPDDRPLLGWLHIPADGHATGVVVLCPTMGLEGVYSYWALRKLAHKLSESGLATLRFDYDGTGDSAGGGGDPRRTSAWLDSVRAAIDYARNLGTGRVSVVGLRIGGTLAAVELARSEMVDDLVLWDPCATGKSFLREQRALWAFLQHQAAEWGLLGEGESWGHATDAPSANVSSDMPALDLGAETVEELGALSVAECEGPLAKRILLLTRNGRKPSAGMSARLAMPHVESALIEGQEELLAVDAVVPNQTLEHIVAWLAKRSDAQAATQIPLPPTGSAVVGRTPDRGNIVERPLHLGPAHLFGVLTEPEGEAARSTPVILLLNAGRISHVGPGRLWVDLARRWSAQGLRCLRVDLSGIGDSSTRPGRKDQVQYSPDALLDLTQIRAAIPDCDASNVVMVGLCSGGYHAIESALAQPIDTVCAINPLLTFFDPESETNEAFESAEGLGLTDRQARSSTRRWLRVFAATDLGMRSIRLLPEWALWLGNRLFVTVSPAKIFERLTKRDVNVLVIAGPAESKKLVRGEARFIGSLVSTGRLRIDTIPHLEHSLLERTGREQVADVLSAFLLERFGPSNAGEAAPIARVTT